MIVVLFDPRRPSLVPVEAIEHLSGEVQYTEEMPVAVPWSLSAARPVHSGDDAPVLLSSDREHPAVVARLAAGARLISAPETPRGERLVDAVAMMDKLRTAGPWESEQTHDSLRRFLLEETYELLDAVGSGNAEALREELGDVLLQVLFHARIAEDAAQSPFTIDDVAATLMRKLGNRVPGVLAGQSISLEEQLAQWEERKAAEKPRKSVMDDVHTGQPALALAQKVLARAGKAGLPADLIPEAISSISVSADVDAESALRAAVLGFVETVRDVERTISAARRGTDVPDEFDVAPPGEISEEEWREHWPTVAAALDDEASAVKADSDLVEVESGADAAAGDA
ncbi:MAG: nucleoside triphosphate pyrophosphohydrolase [Actinomycetota bacterium]|nr:nucleoside triphosphate pyrophosphohydrolase [Actinomycetota bacterium]